MGIQFEHCKNTHDGSYFETPCTIVERGTVYYVLWIYIQTTNGKIFKPERALLAISETWKKPEFPIKSRDILLLGVPEGPLIGEILKEIEDWWIEADFINDKASLFERMKAIVNAKS